MLDKVRVAVFVSGSGTNLQAILDREQAGLMAHGVVSLVVSDRAEAYGLTRARKAGVEAVALTNRACFEDEAIRLLSERGIQLIVLAGFLKVLSPAFVKRFHGRIVNVHPSLLPSFGGKGFYGLRVHEAALARGVKVTGATVHLVTSQVDGGPILAQKAVRVRKNDTAESLQQRVMKQAEWVILPQAVDALCKKLKGEKQ